LLLKQNRALINAIVAASKRDTSFAEISSLPGVDIVDPERRGSCRAFFLRPKKQTYSLHVLTLDVVI